MDEQRMEVDMRVGNGIRYGNFSYGSIYGSVPSQAMTTTNINHTRVVRNSNIDFRTPFLEIAFRKDLSMKHQSPWLNQEIRRMNRIIANNPKKVCLMTVTSARTRRFDKEDNQLLIKLQDKAGFRFIRVYLKRNRNALEELKEYMDLIPEDKTLLPVLDENLKNDVFKTLYEYCLNVRLPIIGFIGRALTPNKLNIKENYLFIGSRQKDNVLRVVSNLSRKTRNGMPNPVLFQYLGYDVFSFASRQTRYMLRKQPLQVYNGLRFINVADNRTIPCEVIRGQALVETIETYRPMNKETVPCSIYTIIQLNREFQNLHNTISRQELAEVLEEDIKVLVLE